MDCRWATLKRVLTDHLFVNVNVPGEVRSEVLDLCADVLLHHSDQRDPELFQLGLQRGQLGSFLPRAEGVTRFDTGVMTNCFTFSVVEYRSLLYLSTQKSSRPPHRHDHGPVCLPQGLRFDHHVFYEAETRRIINKKLPFFFHLIRKKKFSKSTWLICGICCARIRIERECGSSAVRPSQQSNLHYWQI